MSLITKVSDLAVRIGTEIKAVRSEKQNVDADLTSIAAIAPNNDDIIQRKAGSWINRTMAQLKADLGLVKADVGLANADNTSDANKPVSTATQAALNGKQATLGFAPENPANKGVAGGYASLDGTGKVPAGQLPAYVDDVLEFANAAALPGVGTAGIIYVTLDNNHEWRWGGSAYVDLTAAGGSLSNTDSLAEGAVNFYFTNARADARINTLLDAQMGDETTDFVAIFNAALV